MYEKKQNVKLKFWLELVLCKKITGKWRKDVIFPLEMSVGNNYPNRSSRMYCLHWYFIQAIWIKLESV